MESAFGCFRRRSQAKSICTALPIRSRTAERTLPSNTRSSRVSEPPVNTINVQSAAMPTSESASDRIRAARGDFLDSAGPSYPSPPSVFQVLGHAYNSRHGSVVEHLYNHPVPRIQ